MKLKVRDLIVRHADVSEVLSSLERMEDRLNGGTAEISSKEITNISETLIDYSALLDALLDSAEVNV